jgi:transcriptional regulator with AAA-type ATPase domain
MPALVREESLRTWGSRYARLVLHRHNNNKRQTCRALGISYHTLRTYLRNAHRRKHAAASSGSPFDGTDNESEKEA